jgi:ferredoxin-NADP reductase
MVSGPYGRFTFNEEEDRPVAFIAGGVGITPLLSKLRYLVGRQWSGRIDLVYSVRTADDIIFRHELEELGRQSKNLGVHVTITADGGSWTGARGRITQEWLSSVIVDIAEREVHVCGPTSMAASAQSLLAQLGVPAHRVAIEAFGGRKESSSRAGTGLAHEVRFGRSGVSVSAQRGEMLLDTAIDAGVAIDFGCRAGVCGRCKAKLLDGQITTHGEFALAPEEKAAQFFLMCQAEAASNVIIDC